MALISKPINLSTEANLLYEIYKTLKKINIASGSSGSQNLAQTLLIDNKTNNIPIVSNNGKAVVDVNDDYLMIGYEDSYGVSGITFDSPSTMTSSAFWGLNYIALQIGFQADTDINIYTPTLNWNDDAIATQPYADAKVANDLTASTTVAPSKTAVLTEYDMITGLTFSGVFSLDKKGGRSYLPYTQTGPLTLSIGGSPIVGGLDVLKFTANGSTISGYSSWKLLSSDDITATNGVVHRVIVYQYEDEIWYSVKLN